MTTPPGSDPALELRGVSKRFGAVQALDGVDFDLRRGEIHALLGENGAGKSTLVHIAYGLLPADRGTLHVDGRDVSVRSPREARALGLGMVHQHFTSVPALTVAENLALAAGTRRVESAVQDELLGGLDPMAVVETLSVGEKQRLEIAKALAGKARVLLLDEPTAVLAPAEVAELFSLIRTFVAGGGAVVLITHKLREVFGVADRVTVLRHGRVTLTGPVAAETPDTLAAAMLGGRAGPGVGGTGREETTGAAATGAPVLRLERLSVPPLGGRGPGLRAATLTLRAGEIVGVAAIEGNGQRELMLAVAGVVAPAGGVLDVNGSVALIPEDRTTEGLIPDMSLVENVVLGGGRGAPWIQGGRIRWAEAERHTAALLEAYDVRAPGPGVRAGLLSGGNQQRLVLGRALAAEPRVLVAENPTRGLDIQATRAVQSSLRRAAARGVAVLLYSSDLDEVLELAHRVVVVADGVLTEMPPGASRDQVGAAMLGVGHPSPRSVNSAERLALSA
jgi:ABC-type uncharacterized transport system ATPase subunit